MEIVEDFMNKLEGNSPILFDGIPRKIEQARSLNNLLDKHSRNYKAVLIDINEETAMERLTTRRICQSCKNVYPANYKEENCNCGGELITRADDNPKAIRTRLQAFQNETLPAIKMYQDKLIKIDGEPSIEIVEKDALETLDKVMQA